MLSVLGKVKILGRKIPCIDYIILSNILFRDVIRRRILSAFERCVWIWGKVRARMRAGSHASVFVGPTSDRQKRMYEDTYNRGSAFTHIRQTVRRRMDENSTDELFTRTDFGPSLIV